jgi:hypothetical protein
MFENLAKTRDQFTQGGFGENFVKYPKEGVLAVRILPAGGKNAEFYQSTRVHKINSKNVHCPKSYNEQKSRWEGNCPICAYQQTLWQKSEKAAPDAKEAMQNEYRSIKAKPRFYLNAIVRSETDIKTGVTVTNAGPKILSISKQLFDIIVEHILADPTTPEDVTDVNTGKDFLITVTPKGEWPDFSKSKFTPKPSKAGTTEEVAKWLEAAHDLASFRTILAPEELDRQLKIHLGLIQEIQEESTETNPVTSAAPKDTSVGLADDDFLKSLNGLGNNNI